MVFYPFEGVGPYASRSLSTSALFGRLNFICAIEPKSALTAGRESGFGNSIKNRFFVSIRAQESKVREIRTTLLFGKKETKNFYSYHGLRDSGTGMIWPPMQDIKVSWFFSSEKNACFLFRRSPTEPLWTRPPLPPQSGLAALSAVLRISHGPDGSV
jgi:hypothetical protein